MFDLNKLSDELDSVLNKETSETLVNWISTKRKNMKRVIVIGGGTFNNIVNHLALSAPAFGTTAKLLVEKINNTENMKAELVLTKMADSNSNIITNEDLSNYIDTLLEDNSVHSIIMNAAICDFEYEGGDSHGERFKTVDGVKTLRIRPSDKIIGKIRLKRPDIFLVGFKTTTNKSILEQFTVGLKMMKSSKCNLVLCNDVVSRQNFVLTAEETKYHVTTNRNDVLDGLVDILSKRIDGTYERTEVIKYSPFFIADKTYSTFNKVLKNIIKKNGFICNNGNGFTNGHFCISVKITDQVLTKFILDNTSLTKIPDLIFLSSVRKRDHNQVFEQGMVLVIPKDDGSFYCFGDGKPSVGARSQYMLLKENPDMDCIVHTHNPLTEWSKINVVEQYPFQCGSNECGKNTISGITEHKEGDTIIKAVYLNKHGANIMFNSEDSADDINRFIENNLQLGVKTT